MYTLKSIARRGTPLGAAFALLVAAISPVVLPAVSAYADALNPLTQRSLTLSSSSPGWAFTDGSGNTTYAPPGSGANGKQTGEVFSFNTSTDSSSSNALKAFTFQYCIKPAGLCTSPGNDTGSPGSRTDSVANQQSDLNVVTSSPSEISDTDYQTLLSNGNSQTVTGDDGIDYTYTGLPLVDNSQGNFAVVIGGHVVSGWSMTAGNLEDGPSPTGKNNYITLTTAGSGIQTPANTNIKVIFYATNTNYITDPGAGAFFVKINDYNSSDYQNFRDAYPLSDTDCDTDSVTYVAADNGGTETCNADVVDGGVTVANVMNQSIAIQTKVLETMDFSVGTVNPDTLDDTQLSTASGGHYTAHGECNPILTSFTGNAVDTNVLTMGDQSAENSLSTDHTYATHSYWRLSSNSSAGASVYYSGNTLANTEHDHITPLTTTATDPQTGSEQFGLAIDSDTSAPYGVDLTYDSTYEQGADTNNGAGTALGSDFATDTSTYPTDDVSKNQLAPLVPQAAYANGSGDINGSTTAKFAFDINSTAVPAMLATENSSVVNCVTAKMRYIANIAATTPAGIYATKINYIAAPQY